MIFASKQGDILTTQRLVKTATPTTQDSHGRTALHYASLKNFVEVAGILLRNETNAGTLIDIEDSQGKSAMDLAMENHAGAVVALLTFYGGKDKKGNGKTKLELSIRNGSAAAVQTTLSSGRSLNPDHLYQWTALHWAVWRDSWCTLDLLKEKGKCNASARGKGGLTALHLAAKKGNDSIVQLLVESFEADHRATTEDRATALHLAAEGGHYSAVKSLIDLGAEKEARTEDESTALHLAAKRDNHPVIKLLIERGADKKARTKDESTALHLAAAGNNHPSVKLLIELGADKEARTTDGSTALHIAAKRDNHPVIKLLIELGADKEARTNDESTTLNLWW